MKPAFVILFAVLLVVPSHTSLSREEALSVGNAASAQALQLVNPRHLGGQPTAREPKTNVTTLLGNLPLYFIENRGQVDGQVKYSAKIRNGMAYFTGEEIVYQFLLQNEDKDGPQKKSVPIAYQPLTGKNSTGDDKAIRQETIRLSFVGANQKALLYADEKQEAQFNYFRGNDPRKWVSGAPSYGNVIYRDLYPGIDLIVSGREGRMKGEYVVRAGGDPSVIRFKYDGAKVLRVNEKGQLEIQTSSGMLVEDVPLSYQTTGGEKREVEARYEIAEDHTVQFRVGAYRKGADLIIDPLTYSTFLGGTAGDYGYAMAVDTVGNAYITGGTYSSDFPTTGGAYDPSHNGGSDVFMTKLNSSGSTILYSTFLGGTNAEQVDAIVVDGSGNVFATGSTNSSDFPTIVGAYDTSYNGSQDVFLAKLNSSGSALLYSTFLGGSEPEYVNEIATDGSGNAYVAGFTNSADFPTTSGAWDTGYSGNGDVYVTKLNSSGSALVYSTFLGGTGGDTAYGIATDGSGNAYITGLTYSTDFPVTSGVVDQSFNGAYDAFVTKLNSSGGALVYSTFLGGTSFEYAYGGIVADGSANAYIAGVTYSSDFPTTSGAYDTSFNGGSYDGFIVKLNSTATALLYSTFLGGTNGDIFYGLAVDGNGKVYVTGDTLSSDFPTIIGAYDATHNGGVDVIIAKLNASGSALLYSTFLGGTSNDEAKAIAVDANGNAYVAGYTESADYPTTSGAYDTDYSGGVDVFIANLSTTLPDIRQPIADISFGSINVGGSSDQTTTIYNDGDGVLSVNSIIRTSGSSEFTYVGPNLPFAVSAGGSQAVTVKFAPTSAGAKSAVFNVNSDDIDEPDVMFNVSGTGVILTESVSTPSTPVGATSGYIGTSYAFATGNSTSNLGHSVQYYFDWGDGTNTGWLAAGTFSAQKSWSSANTYNVTAKARCATDTAIESSTSSALAVTILAQGRDNSPSNYQIIPECIWAVATGGGTWVSEVQITDITGGSVVSVYFNYGGGGNRRGPFTLWTGPAANYNVKYASILSTIDGLDAGAFDYYDKNKLIDLRIYEPQGENKPARTIVAKN